MSNVVYIGIDAGGSRLRVQYECGGASSSFELAGINLWRDGLETASERLGAAIVRAAREADKATNAIVVAGVAGGMDRNGAEHLASRIVAEVTTPSIDGIVVLSDVRLAHDSIHGDRPGITVVAGTGSVVFVRDVSGQDLVLGGWGFRLGDEGSGYAIGAGALRALTQAIDSGRSSALQGLVTPAAGETLRSTVLRAAYGGSARLQDLAPEVIALAEAGEEEALSVVHDQTRALAALINRGRQLAPGAPPEILLTGGLADNRSFTRMLDSALKDLDPASSIAAHASDAVGEALRKAKSLGPK